ncbi:MAG: glutathione S-transferase [Rhodospirillaceae bacterium]|nr:glutathione S-transferase [Rhodospirillaceae bacterium]MCA8930927.1 glutathione S-transferase [Rhodospirillaceae bacterium]
MTDAPHMRLRTSPTSPYGRKAHVVVIERGLEPQVEVVSTDPWDPETDLTGDNPVGKVPTLILPDGTVLMDSPLVCEYLDWMAPDGPFLIPVAGIDRFAVQRIHALADGLIDAAVTRQFDLRRPEELQWQPWRARQEAAIARICDTLEQEIGVIAAQPISIGHLTMAIALDYIDLRFPESGWRDAHPGLAAWHAGIRTRPSLARTVPPGLAAQPQ